MASLSFFVEMPYITRPSQEAECLHHLLPAGTIPAVPDPALGKIPADLLSLICTVPSLQRGEVVPMQGTSTSCCTELVWRLGIAGGRALPCQEMHSFSGAAA